MSHSNGITYESLLLYLKQTECEIISSLDVKRSIPLQDNDANYSTIGDLQIYCDTLLTQICEELSELPDHTDDGDTRNDNANDSLFDDNDDTELIILDNMIASIDEMDANDVNDNCRWTPVSNSSVSRIASSSTSPLISPILVRNSITESPLSVSQRSRCSSDSSDKSPFDSHLTHLEQLYRLSFYENNDEVNVELLTASQIQKIIEHSQLSNGLKFDLTQTFSSPLIMSDSLSTNESLSLPLLKPLFGCHINSIEHVTCGLILPQFIEKCLIYLTRKGLNSVGIFRKSGVKSRIMTLKQMAEENAAIDFGDYCVYDIADITKTWFREIMPKRLITREMIAFFKERTKCFSLCAFPHAQRSLLQVILRFLTLFANESRVNQMNSHNLAICLAPSLCECDDDHEIFDAQKCLEYCIDHCDALFVISLNSYSISIGDFESVLPPKHESTIKINGGPKDIMKRILYQRNIIDPTIMEWSIEEEISDNSDTFLIKSHSSVFLPAKSIIIQRKWRTSDPNNIEIIENGYLYESRWSIILQGEGKTQVAHMVAFDIRGRDYNWYSKTFPSIHNRQLKRLARSFLSVSNDNLMKSSDV